MADEDRDLLKIADPLSPPAPCAWGWKTAEGLPPAVDIAGEENAKEENGVQLGVWFEGCRVRQHLACTVDNI
jgi:hypothetical protein